MERTVKSQLTVFVQTLMVSMTLKEPSSSSLSSYSG